MNERKTLIIELPEPLLFFSTMYPKRISSFELNVNACHVPYASPASVLPGSFPTCAKAHTSSEKSMNQR